jgi:hypothetical protein
MSHPSLQSAYEWRRKTPNAKCSDSKPSRKFLYPSKEWKFMRISDKNSAMLPKVLLSIEQCGHGYVFKLTAQLIATGFKQLVMVTFSNSQHN